MRKVSNTLNLFLIRSEVSTSVPELFDIVKLLVTLPQSNLHLGVRGAIVDCYDDGNYEVE
ncbi:DUF4926 domain-containing protein, partial [Microcoleus sp. herbarium5]